MDPSGGTAGALETAGYPAERVAGFLSRCLFTFFAEDVDFVISNPPFIGNKRMRLALDDGYVEALRSAWSDVPESADFVLYWWHHASELTRHGQLRRFGLITTNSLRQAFNRRVPQPLYGFSTGSSRSATRIQSKSGVEIGGSSRDRFAICPSHLGFGRRRDT